MKNLEQLLISAHIQVFKYLEELKSTVGDSAQVTFFYPKDCWFAIRFTFWDKYGIDHHGQHDFDFNQLIQCVGHRSELPTSQRICFNERIDRALSLLVRELVQEVEQREAQEREKGAKTQ